VSTLDQVLAELKSENSKLENQLKQVRTAIAALQGISSNGHERRNGNRRTMSLSARRRIAAAQKARWAKWKAARRKKSV
jgi:hypothetical protein